MKYLFLLLKYFKKEYLKTNIKNKLFIMYSLLFRELILTHYEFFLTKNDKFSLSHFFNIFLYKYIKNFI